MVEKPTMSTRPTPNTPTIPTTPNTPTTHLPPRTASNADRLSQVLAAGLERQLSLETCRPCKRQPAQRPRSAAAAAPTAPTDLVVDYDKGTDWSRVTGDRYPNGPRFTKGCPDDEPDCDDGDKVPVDAITQEEFNDGRPIIILGCGHCFNIDSLARWASTKRSRRCIYNDYDMTNAELAELGLTPTFQPLQLLQPGDANYLYDPLKQQAIADVTDNGLNLASVLYELRSDREVVLAAVNEDGFALTYASAEMKNEKEVVLAAVNQNGNALTYASLELKNDKEVVLVAVNQNGFAIRFASFEMRNDREVVLAADFE